MTRLPQRLQAIVWFSGRGESPRPAQRGEGGREAAGWGRRRDCRL